jgi:hypothetical protein
MMKKLFLLTLLPTAVALLYSCKKSSSSTPSQAMTATVNGKSWTASSITDNTTASGGDTILYINGISASGQTIEVEVLNFHNTTGTYNFADTNRTCAAYFYKDSVAFSAASSGQLVISSISSSAIKGSFYFTTADTTVVTNGTFTAPGL